MLFYILVDSNSQELLINKILEKSLEIPISKFDFNLGIKRREERRGLLWKAIGDPKNQREPRRLAWKTTRKQGSHTLSKLHQNSLAAYCWSSLQWFLPLSLFTLKVTCSRLEAQEMSTWLSLDHEAHLLAISGFAFSCKLVIFFEVSNWLHFKVGAVPQGFNFLKIMQ